MHLQLQQVSSLATGIQLARQRQDRNAGRLMLRGRTCQPNRRPAKSARFVRELLNSGGWFCTTGPSFGNAAQQRAGIQPARQTGFNPSLKFDSSLPQLQWPSTTGRAAPLSWIPRIRNRSRRGHQDHELRPRFSVSARLARAPIPLRQQAFSGNRGVRAKSGSPIRQREYS